MGQIVKRKKKGRPSKADLARRSSSGQSPAASTEKIDRRRSLRRRNVRYNNFIDYDDYLDEFEEYEQIHQDNKNSSNNNNHINEDEEDEDDDDDDGEEEDERRKEKKLKLVVKIHNQRAARGGHAREEASSSEEEEESERKILKKRKINGGDDSEAEAESENDRGNDDDDDDNNDQEEKEIKADTTKVQEDSVPGTPSDHPNGLPLPDKKSLELILDKLQKKDTYGVYAEPVDLEELPDYLDVIDHPMDFATVRKKLGNGSYSTLEQFESDVFLISSNAMQYNSPETIYHKQARAIQELARKKFQKLRIDIERSEKELKSEMKTKPNFLGSEKELKSEQKTKPNFLAKKQMKKPMSRAVQEPIGSDFSSGATLATAGDIQNGFVATQASGCDRPTNVDGPVEGNSSLIDNNLDRAEELSSGKGLLSKFGRKSSVLDDNRRATYNISNQPVVRSESTFTTFEGEIKQLVAVGLHAEYSYARSMARFAATLGPVAWKVASQRIEKALPPGFKFGRGWVGEYEPLPTPVLMVETRMQKEPLFFTKLQSAVDAQKGDLTSRTPVPSKENHSRLPTSEAKPSLFHSASGPILEGKPSLFPSAGSKLSTPIPINPTNQKQNLPSRNFAEAQNKTSKQVELNFPPSNYQHDADVVEKQLANNSKMAAPKPREVPRTVGLMQSMPSKQADNNASVGLPNGKMPNALNSRLIGSSSDSVQSQMTRAAFLVQGQEQVLNDPVESMKMSAERFLKQQKPSNQSSGDTSLVMQSVPPVRNDTSNAAAAAAARAWMSIGAGGFKPPTENSPAPKNQISAESLYNPTRQLHQQIPRVQGQFPLPAGMQLHSEKNNFPFQAFMRPPAHTGNDGQFPNRPIVFPQFVATDLSRLQMQSPWRGLSPHSQQKQKQETLPPDLNIGFQSPGSPVKQSSGVMVDSQQPDLALQL
ncbi:uncharacterized protein LOC8276725 isoform X2 [Ricinus communis]|uniref:Bromodomain-containing protein n=1 Tax=Ricinus communis TaxID=3988 RepID=B9SV90_RICCO|nr:uncharacterized protein LOC8276725 isoform X2 [Ricinus communis]EEF32463.1 bromodomain-containing protein [Ricinus communis]|eukprot:XP_002529909.1 uncharacterized protein LOC8276725 isoform X2 [Ricinus communis]